MPVVRTSARTAFRCVSDAIAALLYEMLRGSVVGGGRETYGVFWRAGDATRVEEDNKDASGAWRASRVEHPLPRSGASICCPSSRTQAASFMPHNKLGPYDCLLLSPAYYETMFGTVRFEYILPRCECVRCITVACV